MSEQGTPERKNQWCRHHLRGYCYTCEFEASQPKQPDYAALLSKYEGLKKATEFYLGHIDAAQPCPGRKQPEHCTARLRLAAALKQEGG